MAFPVSYSSPGELHSNMLSEVKISAKPVKNVLNFENYRNMMNALNLEESLELLKSYDIPVAETYFVDSEDELESIAEKLSYPVVVKPNVSEHKTEIGVFTHLKSLEELRNAFRSINSDIAVQKMVRGYEILLGVKKDGQFGHVFALGSGGVFAELFRDVTFRIAPVSRADFYEMLEETKLSKIAKGFRGFEFDSEELFRIFKNFEELASNENTVEADINPLMASRNHIVAVDARIILD